MAASKTPAKAPAETETATLEDQAFEQVLDADPPEASRYAEPEPSRAAPATAPRRSGAFTGFVVGGILAAAGGFGLARFVPEGWPIGTGASTLEAALADQAQQIAALNAKLADLAEQPAVDEAALTGRLETAVDARIAALPKPADPSAAISAAQATIDARLSELDQRLTDVEKRPAGQGGAASSTALAAYERELQALRDQISALSAGSGMAGSDLQAMAEDVKAQLSAATEEIRQLDVTAAADAALGRIQSALEVGGPFADAVKTVKDAGIEIPGSLAAAAESGTHTLVELQRSFPDAARLALEAARRSDMGEGWTERLTSFFKVQTGVRSLQPRDGTDTDAVLSRAEATLASGQLEAALTELAALPDAAKEAMSAWLAEANTRLSATSAFEALTTTMSSR